MKHINERNVRLWSFVCIVILQLHSFAMAAERRLSELSYAGYKIDGSTVLIDTNGKAKLRLSFVLPEMVRVCVSPDGIFQPNPSPAVVTQEWPVIVPKITDSEGLLTISSGGISLRVDKKRMRVDAYDAENKVLLSAESPDDGTTWDDATGKIGHSRLLADSERIYGLGQDNDNGGVLDRRGTVRDFWTGQMIRSGNLTANYPVPFYLSTGIEGRGYGCFVDNVWRLRFDVAKEKKDRLTWTAPGGPIDYYLFDGPSFKTIIDRYTRLTGRPSMLPLWAFGYWQSRCVYANFEQMEEVINRLRSTGFPLDIMVIDFNWPRKYQDFHWGDAWLDPAKKLAEFQSKGVRVVQSNSGPMIKEESSNFKSGWDAGLFATDGKGGSVTCGHYGGKLMDFTHPGMEQWLWPQLKPLYEQGIDGWWLDLIEPEMEPTQTTYYAGKSDDIHNTYALRCFRCYYNFQKSIAPQSRPVILGRAATSGAQRYSGILWTGDIFSDWSTFRAHIPEAQNTGLSGFPWWTNDSGGFICGFYKNDRYGAHARLYERWFEFTCFVPITRAHKSGLSAPFDYGPSVEETCRKYLKLRYRLMPYIYTYAYEAHTAGLPLLRPLVLEYQDDAAAATAKDEYLFGSELLVAPVLYEDITARPVYFPKGVWIGLEDGCEYQGPATVAVRAPQNTIPLFVRAGAIIPMAPDMLYTTEKPWDTITLDVYPSGDSSFKMYRDDGLTTAYEHGEFTTTTFRCIEKSDASGGAVSLYIDESNKRFTPKNWIARFHLTAQPNSVKINGKSSPQAIWSVDDKTNVLTVNIASDNGTKQVVDIALDGKSHPRPRPPVVELPKLDASGASQQNKQIAHILPTPRLPIRIEAANFDKGGEGLAYHVRTPGNPGKLYRSDDVSLVASDDSGGGYAVTAIEAGDWLAYTLDSGDGGWFDLQVRVAPKAAGGKIQFLLNRNDIIAAFDVPAPGVERWITLSSKEPFYVNPGEFILMVYFEKAGFDLANLVFTRPAKSPSVLQAELGMMSGGCKFENGVAGYQFPGYVVNMGPKESCLTVALTAPTQGDHILTFRYSNATDSPAILSVKAGDRPDVELKLPPTGGWTSWKEAQIRVDLSSGVTPTVIRGAGGSVYLDSIAVSVP